MASNISSFGVRIVGVAPLPFVKSSLLGFVIAYFGTFLGELHCPRGDFMPMERKSTLCRLFVLVTLPLIMLKSFKIVHNSACSWPWCRNTASNESWEVNSIRKPTASTPTGSVPPPTWPACPNQLVSMALTAFSISMVWPRENKQKKQTEKCTEKIYIQKNIKWTEKTASGDNNNESEILQRSWWRSGVHAWAATSAMPAWSGVYPRHCSADQATSGPAKKAKQ